MIGAFILLALIRHLAKNVLFTQKNSAEFILDRGLDEIRTYFLTKTTPGYYENMNYALIDESGRIYDPNDKILVFAIILTENLSELEKIIIRARQRVPRKGKRKYERLS